MAAVAAQGLAPAGSITSGSATWRARNRAPTRPPGARNSTDRRPA